MSGYPGPLETAMAFGLALLLFRPRRRTKIAWLAMVVLIVVVGLITKPISDILPK
jgi:hypothetical protein